MPTWEDDIVQALEVLGGSAEYEAIYAEVSHIRSSLPESWKQIIQRNIQDKSSDSNGYRGGKDLFYAVSGLGAGVWGLRSFLKHTPKAIDLPMGVEEPSRTKTSTYRVLRDTNLARQIKILHKNSCQLCGLKIELLNGESYSEAHHIIPIGKPHNGPDTAGNIIVLCPNHHVMCDYGVIKLERDNINEQAGHNISQESISYHNEKVFDA